MNVKNKKVINEIELTLLQMDVRWFFFVQAAAFRKTVFYKITYFIVSSSPQKKTHPE